MSPPLALIVSGREWPSRSFESVLSTRGYVTLRVYSPAQAIWYTRTVAPDLVLIGTDLDRPGEGTDLCRTLRLQLTTSLDTPIIQFSDRPISRTERLEALRAGSLAVLYLPVDTEEFLIRLDAIEKGRDSLEKMRAGVLIDPITELYNTRGLIQRVQEIYATAMRDHAPMSCIAIGLAPASKLSIELVARVIGEYSRPGDIIGRISSDELVVLMPGAGQAGALLLAGQLLEAVNDFNPDRESPTQSDTQELFAGLCAISDCSTTSIRPVELLLRAAHALRHSRSGSIATQISSYDLTGNLVAH